MTDLAEGPVLLVSGEKITASHRARDAYVYVRQSTLLQVRANTESLARQYDLRQRAVLLGWPAHQVVVVDEDLGVSGASAAGRSGFAQLAAQVGLGQVGIVLSLECSRLARDNAAWYRLLGAPRGAVYSGGDGRAPPPGRRSGLVKRAAA